MSIKAKKLKSHILKTGEKIGILIEKNSRADKIITHGSKAAAGLVNEGEKEAGRFAKNAREKLDELRANIHKATAPRAGKK